MLASSTVSPENGQLCLLLLETILKPLTRPMDSPSLHCHLLDLPSLRASLVSSDGISVMGVSHPFLLAAS